METNTVIAVAVCCESAPPELRRPTMKKADRAALRRLVHRLTGAAMALLLGAMAPSLATADENDARNILKAMSDYLTAQKGISFDYDANFEVVTTEMQKLALTSSGTVALQRPDKIRATRAGGFADIALYFDGKTMTLLGKNANAYTQLDVPGTIDHLIDELRDKYQRPLPAADLLRANPHDELMAEVIDVKDLGSGVVGGVECDHLAFRAKDVDWQIWIAQGDRPYPCRYVITSKLVDGGPQYSVQIRNWKTGAAAGAADFRFKNTTAARQIEFKDLPGEFPSHFRIGEGK